MPWRLTTSRSPTNQANVHVLVNSTSYWNQGGDDYSDGGPPCAAKMVDLKLTEANLPLFFGLIPGLSVVPAINARARVSVQQLSYASGGLPIAVPDVDPTQAQVKFIDENTGAGPRDDRPHKHWCRQRPVDLGQQRLSCLGAREHVAHRGPHHAERDDLDDLRRSARRLLRPRRA